MPLSLVKLTTKCESLLAINLFTCISFDSLRSANNAWYSALLLEALNLYLIAQVSLYPFWLTKITPF